MRLFKREHYLSKIRGFYDSTDIIKVITGVRRCGKSCLMEIIKDELIEKGCADENVVYINLDKRGYRSIKTEEQLDKLIASSTNASGTKYLFIDEIQNVKGFEEVINGYREDGDWSIFITGSNSYLLSGELVTKLTGRYIEFEMFPLSFDEYEKMKEYYGKPISQNPYDELNSYILEGGFPRAVLFDSIEEKRIYTEGIIKEIFDKDIKRRIKIRNKDSFDALLEFIISNFASPFSSISLQKALKSNGMAISKSTLARYLEILLDSKIICECKRYDLKSKKAISGEKKYYLSDLSFYFSTHTDNKINYGPVLENIIYVYARCRGYSVSIGRIGKLECDFILRKGAFDYSYVQVAYTILMSNETENREYRPLEEIKDNYPKYVLTTDYLLQHRNGIIHKNLIDFMKNGELFD